MGVLVAFLWKREIIKAKFKSPPLCLPQQDQLLGHNRALALMQKLPHLHCVQTHERNIIINFLYKKNPRFQSEQHLPTCRKPSDKTLPQGLKQGMSSRHDRYSYLANELQQSAQYYVVY
jgi:hypothetical protein